VFAAGCLWFITHATAEPAYLTAILPGQILTGTGVGLLLPSFTATAAATLRPDQLSTGIGVQTMFRQIGAALGLASWVAIVGTPRRRRGRRVRPRAGRSWRSPRCSPGSPAADGAWAARPYTACVTSDEIRERYQRFFEARDHLRNPSAPLIPRNDPSTLLISAGMHPLKPYFTRQEPPPAERLTTCQKCFRTPDIDEVGITKRH
jgi:hypothetical protein